jgi:hypothetical protein
LSFGVSFRAASKVFFAFNIYLNLNIKQPSHTTILNWSKKQGIGNFKGKEYFKINKWILIADESIQFGNKKLLFIIAVPIELEECGRYLTYKDLIPLVIKVSSSWKSAEIKAEIEKNIDIEDIVYAVSDKGNNLTNAFKTLNITHIEDINHYFSGIMQKMFEKDEMFKSYTKHLSDMRAKLSMSKYARIVPPNQRIMTRYMNLTPIFKWGVKMLKLLETNKLTNEEKEILNFLPQYKDFVFQTAEILDTTNKIQEIIKNNGLTKKSLKESLKLFKNSNYKNAITIKSLISEYFDNIKNKTNNRKNVICSSDIIESCFGKYKELVKNNKTVGISDLSLCISAMLGVNNSAEIKNVFEKISINDIKEWRKNNVGDTLFKQKRNLLKQSE